MNSFMVFGKMNVQSFSQAHTPLKESKLDNEVKAMAELQKKNGLKKLE